MWAGIRDRGSRVYPVVILKQMANHVFQDWKVLEKGYWSWKVLLNSSQIDELGNWCLKG